MYFFIRSGEIFEYKSHKIKTLIKKNINLSNLSVCLGGYQFIIQVGMTIEEC